MTRWVSSTTRTSSTRKNPIPLPGWLPRWLPWLPWWFPPSCVRGCMTASSPRIPREPKMPKTILAEGLLARLTDPTRAAAIMGDLAEMAQTRGRGWFFAAYLRTLFSLTWRIVLALFVADIGRQFIFELFHLYTSHTPATWRTSNAPHLLNSAGPLLACVMTTLWFVLPFAAVRYGVRDRFVRLTLAIALGTTVAFLFL